MIMPRAVKLHYYSKQINIGFELMRDTKFLFIQNTFEKMRITMVYNQTYIDDAT